MRCRELSASWRGRARSGARSRERTRARAKAVRLTGAIQPARERRLYNRSAEQLESEGVCLDVNHALGPDVGVYSCHALGHRDVKNQQFAVAPLVGVVHLSRGVATTAVGGGGDGWVQLQSQSAAGSCLTLDNSYPTPPGTPLLPFVSRVEAMPVFCALRTGRRGCLG